MRGKLIVFEGTDGAGKATQTQRMAQRLEAEGIAFRKVNFPRYGSPFAVPVERYLQGQLGSRPGDVGAYAASILYAIDRYASYKEDWGAFYQAGGLILADRYTTSNAVHQASKLSGGEREEYLRWLFDLEYRRLELPAPDLVLYLDLPTELSLQLLRRRQEAAHTASDIHERDEEYLRRCRESAREIAGRLGWQRIDCAREGALRGPEEIHAGIWELVRPLLAQQP